jgi:hypothetical protein
MSQDFPMSNDRSYAVDPDARDAAYWQELDALFARRGYASKDILRNWPAYVMRRDLRRFLSHYELFKHVIDLPGCIVELGVFKGASFYTWANLLEIFCSNDRSRKVFGFDHFKGLVDFAEQDGALHDGAQKVMGGWKAAEDEAMLLEALHASDSLTPGFKRAELVVGDLKETLPRFLEENPGLRISLLHLDLDLYEPTKLGLDLLFPLVLKGGVVCFDEYGLIPWAGESNAVEEYFRRLGEMPVIRKHPFTQMPHGYLIK